MFLFRSFFHLFVLSFQFELKNAFVQNNLCCRDFTRTSFSLSIWGQNIWQMIDWIELKIESGIFWWRFSTIAIGESRIQRTVKILEKKTFLDICFWIFSEMEFYFNNFPHLWTLPIVGTWHKTHSAFLGGGVLVLKEIVPWSRFLKNRCFACFELKNLVLIWS